MTKCPYCGALDRFSSTKSRKATPSALYLLLVLGVFLPLPIVVVLATMWGGGGVGIIALLFTAFYAVLWLDRLGQE